MRLDSYTSCMLFTFKCTNVSVFVRHMQFHGDHSIVLSQRGSLNEKKNGVKINNWTQKLWLEFDIRYRSSFRSEHWLKIECPCQMVSTISRISSGCITNAHEVNAFRLRSARRMAFSIVLYGDESIDKVCVREFQREKNKKNWKVAFPNFR